MIFGTFLPCSSSMLSRTGFWKIGAVCCCSCPYKVDASELPGAEEAASEGFAVGTCSFRRMCATRLQGFGC